MACDPGLATPSHHQRRQAKQAGKAGSQQPKLPDDLLCTFTVDEDGKSVMLLDYLFRLLYADYHWDCIFLSS